MSNLIQNSQAVKKECGPLKAMVKKDVKSNGCDGRLMVKGLGEKRCEIWGGGQEMPVIVG